MWRSFCVLNIFYNHEKIELSIHESWDNDFVSLIIIRQLKCM